MNESARIRRYCKGKTSFIGNTWWEMHEECMIVCAEALIPLSITAVVTTGGSHVSEHAKWGKKQKSSCASCAFVLL